MYRQITLYFAHGADKLSTKHQLNEMSEWQMDEFIITSKANEIHINIFTCIVKICVNVYVLGAISLDKVRSLVRVKPPIVCVYTQIQVNCFIWNDMRVKTSKNYPLSPLFERIIQRVFSTSMKFKHNTQFSRLCVDFSWKYYGIIRILGVCIAFEGHTINTVRIYEAIIHITQRFLSLWCILLYELVGMAFPNSFGGFLFDFWFNELSNYRKYSMSLVGALEFKCSVLCKPIYNRHTNTRINQKTFRSSLWYRFRVKQKCVWGKMHWMVMFQLHQSTYSICAQLP